MAMAVTILIGSGRGALAAVRALGMRAVDGVPTRPVLLPSDDGSVDAVARTGTGWARATGSSARRPQ